MMFETSDIDECTGSFLTARNCMRPNRAPRMQTANPPYMSESPDTCAPKIEYVVLMAGIWRSISLAEATPDREARPATARPSESRAFAWIETRKRDRSLPGASDFVITQLSFGMGPTWVDDRDIEGAAAPRARGGPARRP